MRALLLTTALLLSACAVGQDYARPQPNVPEVWDGFAAAGRPQARLAADVLPAPLAEWWTLFNDSTLNELLHVAEAGNFDMKIATARVEEARAMRTATNAALFPQVNAAANTGRGNKQNIFSDKPLSVHDAAFDASWELDLFGKTRRATEAADATIDARIAEEKAARLRLRSEVAREYISLRNAQRQLALTQSAAASQQETAASAAERKRAGLTTGLEAAQAEAAWRSTLANVPGRQAEITAALNRIAVLAGVPVAQLPKALAAPGVIPVTDVIAVADSPANVIARRPDVAQAEREYAAATALSAVSLAELYPTVSLSALIGVRDTSLAGSGLAWQAGAGALAPIFNAGRIRANIAASDARAQVAGYAYERAVVQALAEVETNLSSYVAEDARRAALDETVKAAKEALSLANERYAKGLTPITDVLSAERDVLTAMQQESDARAKTGETLVRLYKSLGV